MAPLVGRGGGRRSAGVLGQPAPDRASAVATAAAAGYLEGLLAPVSPRQVQLAVCSPVVLS